MRATVANKHKPTGLPIRGTALDWQGRWDAPDLETATLRLAAEQMPGEQAAAVALAANEAVGSDRLFLPMYSQDFNPIERVFATSSPRLRRLRTRSFATDGPAVGDSLATITPGDCTGFFRAAGYRT